MNIGDYLNRFSDKIVNNRRANFGFFLLIVLILTVYMFLENRPLYQGHDMQIHVSRLQGLMNALADGRFPWYINYNGLGEVGYFVKAFYCDILILPFALIGLCSNVFLAYQTMIFSLTVLCGVFMYWSIYKIFKSSTIASFAGIIYCFSSFHILDIFHRAAIGEVFVFAFLPIVVWGIYEIIIGNYKKWYILSIGMSLVIFSHLISSALVSICLFLFVIFSYKRILKEPRILIYLGISALVTVLLTAYYTIPMFEQLASNTFYFESEDSIPQTMRYTFGISHLVKGMLQGAVSHSRSFGFNIKLGLLVTLPLLTRIFIRGKSKELRYADVLCGIGFVSLIMMSNIFPWYWFPFSKLNFMQYPWRIFMFSSFVFSIAGAVYLSKVVKSSVQTMSVFAVLCVVSGVGILSEAQNFTHQIKQEKGNKTLYNSANNFAGYGNNEYLPANVPDYVVDMKFKKSILVNPAIEDYELNKGLVSFDAKVATEIEVPIVYYKGYSAKQGNEIVALKESENGLVELDVKKEGRVELFYSGTVIQKISTVISIIAWLLLVAYIARFNKNNKILKI